MKSSVNILGTEYKIEKHKVSENELIYQHEYQTEEALYTAIEEFAYTTYNHRRPHSYNNYKTPFETRKTA